MISLELQSLVVASYDNVQDVESKINQAVITLAAIGITVRGKVVRDECPMFRWDEEDNKRDFHLVYGKVKDVINLETKTRIYSKISPVLFKLLEATRMIDEAMVSLAPIGDVIQQISQGGALPLLSTDPNIPVNTKFGQLQQFLARLNRQVNLDLIAAVEDVNQAAKRLNEGPTTTTKFEAY